MPSPESALKLMCTVSIEMEEKVYKYPIYNFKFEEMFKRTRMLICGKPCVGHTILDSTENSCKKATISKEVSSLKRCRL
jgi:hypothetical protein